MMAGRVLRIAVWGGLVLALSVVAYLLVNTTFMMYDDEGFVLISLRNYLSGLRLYDDVFSQYGPWPYVYHQFIARVLDAPITHMLGRGLTVLHWTGCSLVGGVLALRFTGKHVAGWITTVAIFGLCWQMTSEPSHPGSLIALLVALAAWCTSHLGDKTRTAGWAAAGLGAIAALLVLTKINVGLLLVAGVGCVALRYSAWPGAWRRVAAVIGAGGMILLPWALMGRQLDRPWVMEFALQFSAAAAGLLWVTPPARIGRYQSARIWWVAAATALLTGTLVCLIVMFRGTSLRALLDAVIFNPIRLPARFVVEFKWLPGAWPVAVACWAAAAKAGWEIRRNGELFPVTRWSIVAIRFIALGWFVWNAQGWPTYFGISHFIVFGLPLLPVFVVPLRTDPAPDGTGRLMPWTVALVALPQVLHAFPVAGSQMAWGTFILLPFFAAGAAEVWEFLAANAFAGRRWVARAGWAALLLVGGFQLGLLAQTGWSRYSTSRPLDLPGAGDIRIEGYFRQALRLLTLNASVHADLLFSRQGMYSYNLWSGVPTPTAQNATHWFWLLDDARQQEIIERLKATPRTAFIVSEALDNLLTQLHVSMASPLQSFLTDHYKPLFKYHDFIFYVPKDSRAVPFGQYEVLAAATPDPAGRPPVLFRANLVLVGRPATIGLEKFVAPFARVADLAGPGTQVFLEPINRTGDVIGPALRLPVAHDLRGLYRLSAFCPAQPPAEDLRQATLVVRSSDGVILGEADF